MDVPLSFLSKLCNEKDFNLNSVCRLCFSAEAELIPIGSELETCESDGPKSLLELIQACVQLEVIDDEDSPQNVCHSCFTFLTKWYEFKYKCHEIDVQFKDWHISKAQKNSKDKKVAESLIGSADNVNFNVDEVLKGATIVKNETSDGSGNNDDFWVLLVEDGPDGKSVRTSNYSSSKSLSVGSCNGQIIASPKQTKRKTKIVTPNPNLVKEVQPDGEGSISVKDIMQVINDKKYKIENGCIRLDQSNFDDKSTKNSNENAADIKSARDLFSKTVFTIPEITHVDEGSVPIIVDEDTLSNMISGNFTVEDCIIDDQSNVYQIGESEANPNNFVNKIQKLIDDNDTILQTSALNVRNAHTVLKTAEDALQGAPSFRNFNRRKKFVAKDNGSLVKKVMSKSVVASRLKKKAFMGCDICGKKFIQYEGLLAHDKSDHSDLPRPSSCFLCNTTLLSEDHLSLHILVKHGDVSYSLDSSDDENVNDKGDRKRKIRVGSIDTSANKKRKKLNKAKEESESVSCYICNETFSSKNTLDTHMESCEKLIFLL